MIKRLTILLLVLVISDFLILPFDIKLPCGVRTVIAAGSSNLSHTGSKFFTLRDAVKTAIRNNDLIKSSIERIKAAESGFNGTTADMLPKLTLDYKAIRLEYEPYLSTGAKHLPAYYASGSKNGYVVFPSRIYRNSVADFNWDIEVTQPVFTGFALLNRRHLAELGISLAKIKRDEAVLNIIEDVKIAYFNILRFRQQLRLAKEQVRSLKSHEMLAQEFYKQGIIPYNDLLKSKVALSNAQQYKYLSAASLGIAISNFNNILDLNIDENDIFRDISSVKRYTPYHFNKLVYYALRHRPLLKSLKLRIRQASLREKIATSRYYPQISIFAAYSQTGQNWLASGNKFSNQSNKIIGLNVSWTLFNWCKTSDNYQKEDHEKLALNYSLESYINNVRLEIKSDILNLKTAYKNIETSKLAVRQAEENLHIANLQYKQRIVTSTEVLDAATYLKRAKLNYYNSLYAYGIFLAKLQRAIGRNVYGY